MTVPIKQTQDDSAQPVEEDTNAEVEQGQNPADEQPEDNDAEEQAPAGDESEDGQGDDDLPDWAREKLTKANSEAAGYRTKLREAEKKLENVKTLEEVDALINDLKAEREQAEQQAAAAARDLLIENIALKYKLPAKLANRLVGETREEIEADAKELAAEFALDSREVVLEGGLNPRNRDADAGADPRALASKYGSRKKRL